MYLRTLRGVARLLLLRIARLLLRIALLLRVIRRLLRITLRLLRIALRGVARLLRARLLLCARLRRVLLKSLLFCRGSAGRRGRCRRTRPRRSALAAEFRSLGAETRPGGT